jgi:hypothetical protein
MIWALLAWYFFGGMPGASANILTTTGLEEFGGRVEIAVDETNRREDALTVLKSLSREVREFEKVFAESGRKLNSLYKNHSSGREEALVILDALDADWEKRQSLALDKWFQLRAILTEDEWSTLFGKEAALADGSFRLPEQAAKSRDQGAED